MANGTKESSTKIGDLSGVICDKEGKEVSEATMIDVAYLPGGHFNLFSCSRLQQEGWNMHGNKEAITMTKGNAKITFDIVIPTAKGAIYAMYFKRGGEVATAATNDAAIENAIVPATRPIKMSIMQAHSRLGHANEDMTRKTAKALGIIITKGSMGPCEGCSVAKAKQKNVPKHNVTHEKSTKFAERIFIDTTFLKMTEDEPKITKPNMFIIVDEATNLKMVYFYDNKNDMVEPTCELIQKWKSNNKAVKFVRMDNAGENMALLKRCQSATWKHDIKFEITARDTPQQNHLAELGIAVTINKARALMAAANIPLSIRYKIWKEAAKTAAQLDGLIPVDIGGVIKSRYEHAFGVNPKFSKHLRTFGEAGTVKTRSTGTPKLANRGVACMFIGYPIHHEGDCYRMWNPVTNGVHTTRDIIWLQRMFYSREIGQNIVLNTELLPEDEDDDDDDDQEGVLVPSWEGENDPPMENIEDDETVVTQNPVLTLQNLDERVNKTRVGRVLKKPQRLIEEIGALSAEGYKQASEFEIKLTNAELNYYQVMTQLPGGNNTWEIGCFAANDFGSLSERH